MFQVCHPNRSIVPGTKLAMAKKGDATKYQPGLARYEAGIPHPYANMAARATTYTAPTASTMVRTFTLIVSVTNVCFCRHFANRPRGPHQWRTFQLARYERCGEAVTQKAKNTGDEHHARAAR